MTVHQGCPLLAVPLVLAKAPVPGQVKTRLAAIVGVDRAADLAAAALLDTLDLVEQAFPGRPRMLALAGDLTTASRGPEIADRLRSWTVPAQRGSTFAERIAHAHEDVHAATGAPVVQIGMDTPHLPVDLLRAAAAGLAGHEGVLGLAEDGGWWVLALADPRHARLLRAVPTSASDTGARTMTALSNSVVMTTAPTTYDVDTAGDAERSAADAPHSRFSAAWRRPEPR
jgi:glycosyltransferase A (GT-A) superfamily protein (DUF2064 family)